MRHLYFSLFALFSIAAQGQAVWQQMASVPAPGRFWAAATGNDTHGYAGTGLLEFSGTNVSDMYEYTAATDSWDTPSYPGGVREGMTGFTIGQRIFFAFGSPFIQFTKTVYEYLPSSQTWVQHPDVPGIGFAFSHGFVIGDTYYIGPENGTNNVYAFNGTTNTWSSVASFPGADRRAQCAFAANGKGYLGMGAGVFSGVFGDWWEYDPVADSWTEVASVFPLADQACATAVNNVGYLYNTGGSGGGGKQLFTYDAIADVWNSDATLPVDRIANASAFTIGGHGYIVFGEQSTSGGNFPSNQLWRFTPGNTGISENTILEGVQVLSDQAGAIHVMVSEELSGALHMELFDLHGRSLGRHSGVFTGSFEVASGLPAGMYMLKLQVGRLQETRKVMVTY